MSTDKKTFAESQAWVKLALASVWGEEEIYADDFDRTIVGETEHGDIWAPKPGTKDWWEPFDLTVPEHRAALDESLRRKKIGFLDLEYADES